MNVTLLVHAGVLDGWNAPLPLLLVKATIILCAARCITLLMQRASAGARHLVWLVTLGMLLLVPALTAWGPLHLPVLPARAAAPIASTPVPSATGAAVSRLPTITPATSASAPTPSVTGESAAFWSMSALSIGLAIWGAVMLAIGASLAYAAFIVRRIVRHARPLDGPTWLAPLYEVADRLGLDEAPRLVRSEEAKMPFACGVLKPTIVLPAESDDWSLDRRQAVLLHELAHVRRHDLIGHTLGRLACALYWFHPLVWIAAKRLRSESERACDDLALGCGTRATDYAEHLLDIVTSVRHDHTPSVALAMARRKEFEGRMLAILDPELRRAAPSLRQSAGLIASLALIAVAVGAAAPVPRAAPLAVAERSAPPAVKPAPADVRAPVRRSTDSAKKIVMRTESSTMMSQSRVEHLSTHISTSTAIATHGDAASKALGMIGRAAERGDTSTDERAALLAKVLRTDSSASLRRIAAWGLAEYGREPVASEALAAALRKDADAHVREMAAWALGNSGDRTTVAIDALAAALHDDSDVEVRKTAAWSLGDIGDRSAVAALTTALGDENAEIRRRSVWGLGNIQRRPAPPALIAMLGDRDADTRELTAWALFNIEDPAAIPALEKAMHTETSEDLQIAYIRALAAIGDKSVDALRGLLESPNPRIKAVAVRALAGGNASGPWPWPWPEPRPNP